MKSFLYRIAAIIRMHSWKDVHANKKSKTGQKSIFVHRWLQGRAFTGIARLKISETGSESSIILY